jgi:ABC-type transport system substrate-binding protein
MYQSDKIFTKVVSEASTRKLMFLAGELMGYGLQSEDFEQYRNSEYCYATPSETIFFFIFNGHIDAINDREAAPDFKQDEVDLQTMTLNSFRRAVAVSFDKEAFCTAISPSRSGGYGLIGNSYIYDPETGARYRDTDQAKRALCDFYSVDISAFDSLDEAVDSITGFDVDTAKEYYTQAFAEALELGYVTDVDGDGICDQTVTITYASDTAGTTFIKNTLDYFNARLVEVTEGTPFAGKIVFVESHSLGDEWSEMLRNGSVDTCLAGWSGSALDPFGLTDLYTNPARAYDAKWFDATKVNLTINVPVDGVDTDVTMTLKNWSDALNGTTVTVDGVEYCFGEGIADVETRLDILAAIETEVLGTYNYIPMLQDGSMALLSKQVYYVVEEYNPIMGRGGISYMKYNYNEAEWTEYVASQDGKLAY